MMEEVLGLSSREALKKLHFEIDSVLQQFESNYKQRQAKSWIKDTLNHKSHQSKLNWISILFYLWSIVSLLIAGIIQNSFILIAESLLISFLLISNLVFELYGNKLRHEEIPKRVRAILENVKIASQNVLWEPQNYPNLCSPYSPCITLQYTYRDNKLVNLPWTLLVKDDIILMRPGQMSPAFCEAIEKNTDSPLLHAKETFAPNLQNPNEIFSTPKARKPVESKTYRLLETPYLNNLRLFLEQSLDRPVTYLNLQRHLVTIRMIERVFLPLSFFIVLFVNFFRYFFPIANGHFSQLFFVVPISTILPLLPLIFPIAWNILNYVGSARFKTVLNLTSQYHNFLLEEDTENTPIVQNNISVTVNEVWRNFLGIIQGKPDFLIHSANILHVLGSVTALGCVDKKGILSWPNPTAEKVFFLHNNSETLSANSSLGNVGDICVDDSPTETPISNIATTEVLDLTHNHSEPFKLHFDDHRWHYYLSSLKPLGLAILLNTCNNDTQEQYTGFCSHITCEAIYNESLVPVTNRRCLCELAKEIGFIDQAQKIFSLEQQLYTFRHLQPEMVRRDNKYARSLHLSTKLKFPFPHMFAVIVKELSSGSMQLLSEGTADIILDSCVDYWDGHDLCPLTNPDRKRIQDFYQRSSLTAYCTAFAYKPLNKMINKKMAEVYLELPSDCRNLYNNYRSPTPVHWDCKSVLEPKIKSHLGPFFSTDSLLYNDCPSVDVSDAETGFQTQCNQIFIGMVTMQYQALADMVQLIEQLERACIRFVHFSKENELRSRVFSEKMGLESGWNCHISLLSERNRRDSVGEDEIPCQPRIQRQRRLSQSARKLTPHSDEKSCLIFDSSNLDSSRTMSFSAPSAINMEHAIVKFDSELDQINLTKLSSNDNVQNHSNEWQSLSCLTDSTEQSAPINFDMSNRAKLPRGIDKIRPHIELIDNVPLLVSLFTDCTSMATREMLHIMQDYGEIVCVMGSSANCENAGIFMQADASIAIDPLYPQNCQKNPIYQKTNNCISPIDLSRDLNTIPCSLNLKRDDPISFYHLIMEARHFVTTLFNAIQFWISCLVILTFTQLVALVLMLPPPFSTGQLLYLSCIVIPTLSISLMALPVDPEVMKRPQSKNHVGITVDLCIFIIWGYGFKFIGTTIVILISFIGILSSHCREFCIITNCTCQVYYLPTEKKGVWEEDSWTVLTSRLVLLFIVILHFVVISIGFVDRDHLIFKKPPIRNFYWIIGIFVVIIIQSVYTILTYWNLKTQFTDSLRLEVPIWVIIFGGISPVFVFFINELIKRQEIMVNKRFRKRARLDFGTKLGMNSPF